MNYKFPIITHIDDVLPAIVGCSDFIVAKKDGYTVVNYMVAKNDTFPEVVKEFDAIRRECRGIIFCSETGKILRRPLHKFFNLGERTETLPDNIDFKQPHIIMDKLDGSMIVPFMLDGKVRWGTKMGLTEVAAPVEEWVKGHDNYRLLSQMYLDNGVTPIFEWCSPQQKIVLPQKEDRLILTAVRETVNGRYAPVDLLKTLSDDWKIEVCPVYDGQSVTDVHRFIEETRAKTDIEGYVVRFEDGSMTKIKTEWYCNIHKIKEQINSERSILELYFSNGLDDALALLDQNEKDRINIFITAIEKAIYQNSIDLNEAFMDQSPWEDRKGFALGVGQSILPIYKNLIFKMWDMKDHPFDISIVYQMLRDVVRKSLTNNQNYEKMKDQLFKDVVY